MTPLSIVNQVDYGFRVLNVLQEVRWIRNRSVLIRRHQTIFDCFGFITWAGSEEVVRDFRQQLVRAR